MGKDLDIKIQVRHGDTPISARSRQAKSPPDVMITTPETLQAIMIGRRMKEHLRSVRWVVVDEVHELATDERGVQLSLALERLTELTGVEFQRIGLSATIGEPERIGQFLVGTGRRVAVLRTDDTRGLQISVRSVHPSSGDQKESVNLGLPASTVSRARMILGIIQSHKSTLVFTNTREHAEALAAQIQALGGGIPVRVHHGSLSRELREEAEKEFQEGKLKALICTSSLELGIDIGSVDFIIQYTSPRETTRLVQRVGRSGHTLGGTSRGVIMNINTGDILASAVLIQRTREGRLERLINQKKAYDILAHQIIGLLLQKGRMTVEEIGDVVHRSYPFREIDPVELGRVIAQLDELRLLRKFDQFLTARNPKAIQYYFTNLSVIPDVQKYTVFDFFRKRRIGSLDQDFVARRCASGTEFILHGQTWKVLSVDEEQYHVEVEAAPPSLTAIPGWEGDMIPVQIDVAEEVGRARRIFSDGIVPDGFLEKGEVDRVESTLSAQNRHAPIPSDKLVLVDIFKTSIANDETRRELFTEKLDVKGARTVLERIGSGEISIETIQDVGQCTPFALPILDRIVPHGLLRPAVEEASIIEVVKSRLLSTNLRLLCMNCGEWDSIRGVDTLREVVRCPKCRSSLIAATYRSNDALGPIINKKKRGSKLSPEEEKEWMTAWRSAGLIQNYGKRAGIVLAARGVGPTTATRILRNRLAREDDLYLSVLRAERDFERTRMFWD